MEPKLISHVHTATVRELQTAMHYFSLDIPQLLMLFSK